MSILSFISGAIKPITKLIDNITTTDEERGKLVNELTKLENQMSIKLLEYESELLKAQSSIIVAEAKGQSRLQRNWRPLTMLAFLALIILHYCGVLAHELAPEMWGLLKIGLGGYVIGRSAEKIAPSIIEKFKGRK